MKKLWFCLPLLLLSVMTDGFLSSVTAEEAVKLSKGQTVYVPVYSHIYAGNRKMPMLLTVTLSIRNVDPGKSLTLLSAEYYGTDGKLLRQYLNQPVEVGPLEATFHIIPQKDKSGGAGASFLVRWTSDEPVNAPLVESVMIGAEGQQGISFTSRGQVITTSN